MTQDQLISTVISLPLVRSINIPVDLKQDAVENFIPVAIDEIVSAHDWDFAMGETTYSGGSVANQAQYTLEGTSSNARDIISIKYDTQLLDKMHALDADIFLRGRTHTITSFWIPDGRVNKFPRIILGATPAEASKEIKYRFRKNNVVLNEFPDEFQYVLICCIAKWMQPAYIGMYEQELRQMKDQYSGGGGWEQRPAWQDPFRTQLHNHRSTLYGWN